MTKITQFTVEGAEEIQRVLMALPREYQKRAMNSAFKAGAEIVAAQVKDNIRSKGIGLGIGISTSFNWAGSQKKNNKRTRSGLNFESDVVVSKPTKSQRLTKDTVYVIAMKRPRSRLAHIFEFGTAPRAKKNGGFTGQIIAKPFLRPALDTKGKAAIEAIARITRENIEMIVNQLTRGQKVRLSRKK